MPEAQHMAEIHERVGKLEQKTHTLEYQVSELRALPTRVSALERDFAAMSAILSDIKIDTSQTRSEIRDMKTYQDRTAGAINALPRYIKATLFIITISALGGIYSIWMQ